MSTARERAQQASSEMSMLLEGPKVRESAVQIDESLVEEMCAHLLKEKLREIGSVIPEARSRMLPKVNYLDGGPGGIRMTAVTREDFERLLSPWKRELGRLMLEYPRNKDETYKDYFPRLRSTVGSHQNWWNNFERMKLFLAHIARIDDEERAQRELEASQRRREEEAQRARERARRAELERQAKIDEREVKRLLAVIAEAEEAEALIALHKRAESARDALRSIYAKEREVPEAVALDNGYALGFVVGRDARRDPPILPTPEALAKESRRGGLKRG